MIGKPIVVMADSSVTPVVLKELETTLQKEGGYNVTLAASPEVAADKLKQHFPNTPLLVVEGNKGEAVGFIQAVHAAGGFTSETPVYLTGHDITVRHPQNPLPGIITRLVDLESNNFIGELQPKVRLDARVTGIVG